MVATALTLTEHLEGLRTAHLGFVRAAERAGLKAMVPTTPAWTVRKLVAHQGMVHRWAAGIITGQQVDPDAVQDQGQVSPDPLEWLTDGVVDLAAAISSAPDDLDALVFLADAPPAKRFWARRQCHETTIHAVDALAAALGRYPRAADTWITDEVALDGIDELLTGFLPRPRSRLRSEESLTIAVAPTGLAVGWEVRVSAEPPVTVRTPEPRGDVLLSGSPGALYLTLWNRSDEVKLPDAWADSAITWN
ncbi:maleylpyruvate isomerase N-terminal domain-containing protein [Nocardioides sp. AE5]|uniref:maleylpyruvate isomerase N-terminal domain-containing protein n=1 Tax=Nocardioides sp. AE5 TaxID=2962573 RepID=UPI002881C911|nr:maleylpyruvate isomerase N-terminal domain-containing protein [Nocardioides sp. AE5]MDT0202364.1 maleylpyruvate isomerase N-terminal domain-containing protein [Nocardioides sp. AE5]